MSRRTISVVIPSFNEERSVQEMVDRLTAVFRDDLPQYDYEIIFVDDFSTDGTRGDPPSGGAGHSRLEGCLQRAQLRLSP